VNAAQKEDGQRKRVLVVEDAPDIRDSMRELLEMDGYPVTTAENGKVALDVLESMPPPCLILLDLMMPVMDGFEFLERLQRHPNFKHFEVLLISANRDIHRAAKMPGVIGYLYKPFDLDQLMTIIEEHCCA
jgi:CheY-like chemotaxis protein